MTNWRYIIPKWLPTILWGITGILLFAAGKHDIAGCVWGVAITWAMIFRVLEEHEKNEH